MLFVKVEVVQILVGTLRFVQCVFLLLTLSLRVITI